MKWPFSRKPERKDNPVGRILFVGQGQAAFSERNLETFAREGYSNNVTVFRCVDEIASGAASVPLKVQKRTGDEYRDVDQAHPLVKLLAQPNPGMSGKTLIHNALAFRLITGNSFLIRFPIGSTAPLQIWNVPPQNVTVLKGRSGLPAGYKVRGAAGDVTFPVDAFKGTCDMMHHKTFSPISEWYGMSPLEAAAYVTDINNQVNKTNMAMLQNGGRPSGALKLLPSKDGGVSTLSDEQYTRLKQQIDEQVSGSGNSGRPLLLEGGLDWVEMQMSPRDMDFLKSKESTARDIASAYRVPAQILGIPGDSTFNNMESARQALWENAILPTLDTFLADLNRWLTPLFGDDLHICYDGNEISALAPKREAKFRMADSSAFLTINEKRKLAGLDTIPEGDVLLVSSTMIPIDMAGESQQTDPNNDPNAQDSAAKRQHIRWLLSEGFTPEEAKTLVKIEHAEQ